MTTYKVIVSYNGKECLTRTFNRHVDAIICYNRQTGYGYDAEIIEEESPTLEAFVIDCANDCVEGVAPTDPTGIDCWEVNE